jgi:COP9 signalosome complex subunit 6
MNRHALTTRHPLPILNISDHHTRARLTTTAQTSATVIGALLGSQANRQVSIVNSFELVASDDFDTDFFDARKEQCMPSQESANTSQTGLSHP